MQHTSIYTKPFINTHTHTQRRLLYDLVSSDNKISPIMLDNTSSESSQDDVLAENPFVFLCSCPLVQKFLQTAKHRPWLHNECCLWRLKTMLRKLSVSKLMDNSWWELSCPTTCLDSKIKKPCISPHYGGCRQISWGTFGTALIHRYTESWRLQWGICNHMSALHLSWCWGIRRGLKILLKTKHQPQNPCMKGTKHHQRIFPTNENLCFVFFLSIFATYLKVK